VPVHNYEPLRGEIVTIQVESKALEGNLLGDPTTRQVAVHLPPGYHTSQERYPLMVDLAGYTGSGLKHLAWQIFGETLPQRIERLHATGAMGPAITAFPDCFTSLGGNQYINSVAMGRWADYLLDEMLPALEKELRLLPGPAHRAVFGKSSGGYGAIIQGLRYAEHWGGVACHSGDMAFEWCYLPGFPEALTMLARFEGDVSAFLSHMADSRKVRGNELHVLMTLAMAATYDPDPNSPKGVRLPVDTHTCELVQERWNAWLAHDPLRLADDPGMLDNLRSLRGLFIDCGSRDQYHLQYAARAFVRKLEAAGVGHTYEEFDDNHSGIDYRMDVSLPFLYDAIKDA
jgi:hypothetical protein